MSTHTPVADELVHLRAAGVSLLLDLRDGRLPSVVHWGDDLGPLDPAALEATALAVRPIVAANNVDVPIRVGLLPEQRDGWTGRPGLSGSRDGRSWSPAFAVTSATLAGAEDEADADADAGEASGGRLDVHARDDEAGLALEVTVELTAAGVVRVRARLANAGAEPYAVEDLVLALRLPARATEVLDLAGHWGKERVPQRHELTVGTHLREGRKGRTGADAVTVLHCGTAGFGFAEGELWAVHVAWSGNHTTYAERLSTGARVLGGGELLLPGEVRLSPGESYETPWLYGVHGHGLDAVARRFHRQQRSRALPVDRQRPVLINVWEAVYFDHDLPRLVDLAQRAAAVGVERFVLDDGWFGSRRDDLSGLGDWVVSPDVWPQGLHPLIDQVRSLGMEFGLWFEPEMVNPDSDVARAHPEWVMAARREWPVSSRNQQVLDLAVPEAYAHVRDQMVALLEEYDIGYLKWDHNRDLVEAGNQLDGGRPAVHAQTLAVYRLMDELRAAFPGLEIESCSSGGARVDLGVLERADRVWVSDDIDPRERQPMLRWTSQLLPPEYLGSHIASGASHTTGRQHSLDFRAGTAIFGHLGIEWDLASASEDELRDLEHWVSFYRERRGLLLGGDIVRVDSADPSVWVHGVVDEARDHALFAYVSMDLSDEAPGGSFTLRDLDPAGRYRVRPLFVGAGTQVQRPVDWFGPLETTAWGRAGGGIVLPGSVLHTTGLARPGMFPDQVLLLEVERI